MVKVVTINSLGMGWEEIAVENAMSDPLLLLGTLRWTTGKIVQALLEDGSRYGLGEIPSDKQYEGAVWSFVLLIEKHTRAELEGRKKYSE